MTKQEALDKITTSGYDFNYNAFVDALEALGLIKFDEPQVSSLLPEHVLYNAGYRNVSMILDALNKAGYKITRKDNAS